MNDSERQLVDLLLDGELPAAERERFPERLEKEPEAVGYLAERAALQACLRQSLKRRRLQQWALASAAPGAGGRVETTTVSAPRARRTSRKLAWAVTGSVAAGLLVGFLSASMVWAYVARRGGAATRQTATPSQNSFGIERMIPAAGVPTTAGAWSGEPSLVAGGQPAIRPKDGSHALRLDPPNSELFSYMHYIVELQQEVAPTAAAARLIEVTASVLPAVRNKKHRYVLRAAALADDPAQVDSRWIKDRWPEAHVRALAHAAQDVSFPPAIEGRQTIRLGIQVPPTSRILVIWVAAVDAPDNRASHFLDDVRLSALIPDATPIDVHEESPL